MTLTKYAESPRWDLVNVPLRTVRTAGNKPFSLHETEAPPPHWTPPEISLLTVDQLLHLPGVGSGACASGVYFLWKNRRLVYIGSSVHIRNRLLQHLADARKDFDAATFMLIAQPWHMAFEALYIRAYTPEGNLREHG